MPPELGIAQILFVWIGEPFEKISKNKVSALLKKKTHSSAILNISQKSHILQGCIIEHATYLALRGVLIERNDER